MLWAKTLSSSVTNSEYLVFSGVPIVFHRSCIKTGMRLWSGVTLYSSAISFARFCAGFTDFQVGNLCPTLLVFLVGIGCRQLDGVDFFEDLLGFSIGNPGDRCRGETRTESDNDRHDFHHGARPLESCAGEIALQEITWRRPSDARKGEVQPATSLHVFWQPLYCPPAPVPAAQAGSFFLSSSVMSDSSFSPPSTVTSLPSWSMMNMAGIAVIPQDLENSPSQPLPW